MPPLAIYILMQLPGITLVSLALYYASAVAGWITIELALALLGVWLVKDALLYFPTRPALLAGPAIGTRALIGRRATVRRPLNPKGQVIIDGEYWRARAARGAPIPSGAKVEIVGAERLLLIVVPNGLSGREKDSAPDGH